MAGVYKHIFFSCLLLLLWLCGVVMYSQQPLAFLPAVGRPVPHHHPPSAKRQQQTFTIELII